MEIQYGKLFYLFGILLILISVVILYLEKPKGKKLLAHILFEVFTLCVLFLGYLNDLKKDRDYQIDKGKVDCELSENNLKTAKAEEKLAIAEERMKVLDKDIALSKEETEWLELEVEKTKIIAENTKIEAERLRMKALGLELKNDSLRFFLSMERHKRHQIEQGVENKRGVMQSGPIINNLEQFDSINVIIQVVDNGEAIHTAAQLSTLFQMVNWNVVSHTAFIDPQDNALLNNKIPEFKEMIMYGNEGILIHYNENDDFFNKSKAELAGKELETNLLAIGLYADESSTRFHDYKLPQNTLLVIIGNKPSDEQMRIEDILDYREDVVKIKVVYDEMRQRFEKQESLSRIKN